jgi:hypothetical protein
VLGQWQLCVCMLNNIPEPELSSENKGKLMLLSPRLELCLLMDVSHLIRCTFSMHLLNDTDTGLVYME